MALLIFSQPNKTVTGYAVAPYFKSLFFSLDLKLIPFFLFTGGAADVASAVATKPTKWYSRKSASRTSSNSKPNGASLATRSTSPAAAAPPPPPAQQATRTPYTGTRTRSHWCWSRSSCSSCLSYLRAGCAPRTGRGATARPPPYMNRPSASTPPPSGHRYPGTTVIINDFRPSADINYRLYYNILYT